MRIISVVILFACMMAATFSDSFMIASFKFNQQYISKTLCINKDKPAMHCNGNCYLNRQLEKTEKSASPINTKSNQRFQIQFCNTITEPVHTIYFAQILYLSNIQKFTAQEFVLVHLRPPQA